MLFNYLPKWVSFLLILSAFILNLVFWGVIVFALGLVKILLPVRPVSVALHAGYAGWCKGNRYALKLACDDWIIEVNGELDKDAWYLLIANHQSWLDIVLLSALGVLPAPKFFLKDELKYVPFVGTGAWAMDMPFMKRASKAKLAANPKLKGMDVERTKRSCRNFKNFPTTIINFVEGTRYTQGKHTKQESPFKNLLKPKAGGIAFALEVLGEQMDGLLDTAIVYHCKTDHICRDMLLGDLQRIHVRIDVKAIDTALLGNYQLDRAFRVDFQQRLNRIWQAKDLTLSDMKRMSPANDATTQVATQRSA